MDKTRTVLKTSLKHCIAGWNAILTTSIAMLPRFIVITRIFAIFLCQPNVLRRRKKEIKNKGESNLTKNHNLIVSHTSQIDLLSMISIFPFFFYFKFKVFIKSIYKCFIRNFKI